MLVTSVRERKKFRFDNINWISIFGVMKIEVEKETDGRWIAEIPELPGVMAYGDSKEEAVAKSEALALRIIAERIDHGETIPELGKMFSVEAA
jgi:predicted RNase H-like HicB family nuclease